MRGILEASRRRSKPSGQVWLSEIRALTGGDKCKPSDKITLPLDIYPDEIWRGWCSFTQCRPWFLEWNIAKQREVGPAGDGGDIMVFRKAASCSISNIAMGTGGVAQGLRALVALPRTDFGSQHSCLAASNHP